jgi:hypothetical protein
VRRPKSNERTERWLALAAEPSTFEAICTAQAAGRSAVTWCKERDVRYMDVMRWIEDDPNRAFAFELATKARGAQTVQQLEGVTRMAIAGTVDPRAAAVASKNMQWLASVYDRKKFGEQMRVDHKHGFSADHLATLKALASSVSVQRIDQFGAEGDMRSVPRVSADGFQHAPQSALALARVARPAVIDAQFRSVPDPERQAAAPNAQVLDEAELFGI